MFAETKTKLKITMAKATIKLEFNAGDNIEGAFKEAIRLATSLGVWCEFNFNGVTCLANANGEVEKGVEAYHCEIKKKDGRRMAFA